ncbi:uncharacterized protein TrAtP1_006437 [Trichoderma atroviride]|uniref:uncharacterized protein n=1 Tax=Hypocrea atroviridis TaxID=63577 RepID=UPI0033193CA7|nr:hypothetical protein TrAtP1_006437 [Trichoderma atroviride]
MAALARSTHSIQVYPNAGLLLPKSPAILANLPSSPWDLMAASWQPHGNVTIKGNTTQNQPGQRMIPLQLPWNLTELALTAEIRDGNEIATNPNSARMNPGHV